MIPDNQQDRDAYFLGCIQQRSARIPAWAPLTLPAKNGHTGTVWVLSDAIAVPDGTGGFVRLGVGSRVSQEAADMLDALLLTSLLADIAFDQRARTATPHTYPSQTIGQTSTMVACSAAIDAELAPQGDDGLAQTVGKHWILNKKGVPMNYGWHVASWTWNNATKREEWRGIPVYSTMSLSKLSRVIQQPGTAHNDAQADNAQTLVVARRACIIDGAEADLADVLADPALCPLVSCEGPLSARLLLPPGALSTTPFSSVHHAIHDQGEDRIDQPPGGVLEGDGERHAVGRKLVGGHHPDAHPARRALRDGGQALVWA